MAIISIPNIFSVGATIVASQHNSNFSTIYNQFNGLIDTTNLSPTAAIAYTQMSLTSSIKTTDLTSAAQLFLVPSGGIIMWSGSIATIPSGWFLCNGSNSTPDLRDKFIIAASADNAGVASTNYTGSLTQTGGSLHHTHTVPTIGIEDGTGSPAGGATFDAGSFTQIRLKTGGVTGNESDVPVVYYSLAYIMKS